MTTSRACPVCFCPTKRRLFRQELSRLSQGSLMDGFDLAVCDDCGAAYADGIPAQEAFDRYYAEMSKYEYSSRAGAPSESDQARFADIAESLAPHLRPDSRLLDIGCATGGLLDAFRQRGCANLLGVDPSPACVRLTTELHGVPARCATLRTLDTLGERADLVLLTGVIEHLRDVDDSLRQVRGCLGEGGSLYVEVPDASRYDEHFSAPFQLFSMEHVNYFSPRSLDNLLARHGFSPVFSRRVARPLSAQAMEPTIAALYRLDGAADAAARVRDTETAPALERYIAQSRALEERVRAKVAALAAAGRPLAVWGVGTHTLRLLETSRLPEARIVAFLDSNANYQGKSLAGVPVLAPADFADRDAEVLISTQTAEQEIARTIAQTLRWPNKVHRLYGEG